MPSVDNAVGQPKATVKVTENKPSKRTMLTEELPAGGLTQEEFKHDGVNITEEGEEEEGD